MNSGPPLESRDQFRFSPAGLIASQSHLSVVHRNGAQMLLTVATLLTEGGGRGRLAMKIKDKSGNISVELAE